MEIRTGIVIIMDVNGDARFICEHSTFLVQPTPEHSRDFCGLEAVHACQGILNVVNEGLQMYVSTPTRRVGKRLGSPY
jgi:hypothetical protein